MTGHQPLPQADDAAAPELLARIRSIWERSRAQAARSVNSAHVCANWLIGQQIVDAEQGGAQRAGYGQALLKGLAGRLSADFGTGFSLTALKHMRGFYLAYPRLLDSAEHIRSDLPGAAAAAGSRQKGHALRDLSGGGSSPVPTGTEPPGTAAWQPGQLHTALAWTHDRALLKVARPEARDFYEIEAVKNAWSARQLERQIASLLFERLAGSRDPQGVLALAREGLEPAQPADLIKDPYVLEFLDLPEAARLHETQLEVALISQLQGFLLELGSGFAFVGRQLRLTLDGDHFYPDLVFYHVKLKCYVLIDLKVGKLDHADLGQMQLYVNWYDAERADEGDNPSIGLILCTEKNDAVVRYVLGDKNRQIFASRYQLYLPTEAQLQNELRRELARMEPKALERDAPDGRAPNLNEPDDKVPEGDD
ncbi:MAG TPA: PDDEXK nuclease domain-containing protein [Burkholderiaceae bacterium]|nr:PDDEXK nuclease domain-containing protein [Burkholderiaceae bacterium]